METVSAGGAGGQLLASESEYLRRRAAEVGYSAQVLFQELRRREYRGSYETVKRFVRPLRGRRSCTSGPCSVASAR